MPRRSSRSGVKAAKAKAKVMVDYLQMPDHKILAGALPSPAEKVSTRAFNVRKDRVKPSKRVQLALERPKRQDPVQHLQLSANRRHILFLNVGDERILEGVLAITRNQERPPWMRYLKGIVARNGRLYLEENGRSFEFALKNEKRLAVKKLYFDPKEPATIQPITDKLRESYCNISRTNVRNILRSIESYQLMFPRRKHPKIQHHTVYTKPGVIAMDTFFKSGKKGWEKMNILVCMDVWSRFSRAYALEKKETEFFEVAMKSFFQEFTSLGHLPRRLLTDKGSELFVGTALMEKYRLPQDGKKPLHLKSFTDSPVQVVENMNSQYQRRLEPYLIAGLHNNVEDLLWDISEQLNNQKRQRRKNYTPYQLLAMGQRERNEVNRAYTGGNYGIGLEAQKTLPILRIGHHVRKLEMGYKEQQKNAKKGFEEKWSRKVYQVLKITALRRNPNIKKYSIGLDRTFLRHELLLIPKKVDSEVLVFPTSDRFIVEEQWVPH